MRAAGNKEAGTLLRRAIAINPNFAAAHNNLGNVVHALGQPQESLAHFDRAIALDPDLRMPSTIAPIS